MAKQTIGLGAAPNDGTGDTLRVAFDKCNDNFTELYDDKAPLASPTFTGVPAAPTAAGGTNTTQVATTAFVTGELTAKAPLASPTFTGTPAAPTAAGGTNTTQLATTAFVTSAVAAISGGFSAPVTGTPGTGAATPTTPAEGFPGAAVLEAAQFGLFLYIDGSAWEKSFGYWNGTTITRPAAGFVESSTGSQLSLTSAATVTLITRGFLSLDRSECLSRFICFENSASGPVQLGLGSKSDFGTPAASALASTNFLTKQTRQKFTSATTANATAGATFATAIVLRSTTAGCGGFHFFATFGASQLPTGPRLMVGLGSAAFTTAEPSALTAHVAAFEKDSTDTNIQFVTNDNSGTGTKTTTGLPWAANGWYEVHIYCPPGGAAIHGVLLRWDTGDIWYGSRNSDLPGDNVGMGVVFKGGLNGTDTGTAIIMEPSILALKAGQ